MNWNNKIPYKSSIRLLILFLLGFISIIGISNVESPNFGDTHNLLDGPNSSDTFILTESADPTEFGNKASIIADIIDPHGVLSVLIEVNGINYSMVDIGSNQWQYEWLPESIGIDYYTVSYEDGKNRWKSLSDSINIIDSTTPIISKYKVNPNPYEIGKSLRISLKVEDNDEIDEVLIDYDGYNHSLTDLGGGNYEYTEWLPINEQNYPFTIYVKDINGNINIIHDTLISKIDATPPGLVKINKCKIPAIVGNTVCLNISAEDLSGIKDVLINIEGINHSLNYVGENTWELTDWVPEKSGLIPFTIYIVDNYDNWNITSSDIEIVPPEINIIPILDIKWIIFASLFTFGSIVSAVYVKSKNRTRNLDNSIKSSLTTLSDEKIAPTNTSEILKEIGTKNEKIIDIAKENKVEEGDDNDEKELYNGPKKKIHVICPTCKKDKYLDIPQLVVAEKQGITTLDIPKKIVCEHHFQIFLDKNFQVRGYQKVDFQIKKEKK